MTPSSQDMNCPFGNMEMMLINSREFLPRLGVDKHRLHISKGAVHVLGGRNHASMIDVSKSSRIKTVLGVGRGKKGFSQNWQREGVTLIKLQKPTWWLVSSHGYFRCWDCYVAEGCFCLPWWVENCFQELFPWVWFQCGIYCKSPVTAHCLWPQGKPVTPQTQSSESQSGKWQLEPGEKQEQ